MMKQPRSTPGTRGFARAASLMQQRIRKASEGRGFAQTRVLTHWAEIVGADIAACTQPVNVSFGKGGMGATLTLLTTGALAPQIDMQKEQIREKVNACYGYRAISRIRITQTAPTGFAEGRAQFAPAPRQAPVADPETTARARAAAQGVASDGLRTALEALAANVLSRHKPDQR